MGSLTSLSRMIWWGWCGAGALTFGYIILDIKEATWPGVFISVSLLTVWSIGFLFLTMVRFASTEESFRKSKPTKSEIQQRLEITKEWHKLGEAYGELKISQDQVASLVNEVTSYKQNYLTKLRHQYTKPSDN